MNKQQQTTSPPKRALTTENKMNNEQNKKEIVIITFESGHMIAVDKDQALNEILAYFDNIQDIQLVEYISPS